MRRYKIPGLTLVCLLFFGVPAIVVGQTSTVAGQVTDNVRSPLAGVNIRLKGTSQGVTSDEKGNYSIAIPFAQMKNGVLVFSIIGYTDQEVAIANQARIDIGLETNVQSLNNVVVVGYGVQKKATLTGAISEIKTADIAKNAVGDLSNSIAGRLSGVVAVQSTGKVGEDGAALYIRGPSTFNDNSPLVLVDGIERSFNHLDPNTIESMVVLKDASATAVYGVRGANGVILVTTKRGKISKPIINYTSYYGIQNPIRVPSYLNSYDYATLYDEAQLNDDPSLTPDQLTYSPEDIQKYKDHSDPYGYPDVDWNNERFRDNSPIFRQSISISGGSPNIRYYTSLGTLDQQGVIHNNYFKTYNLRANIDADVSKSTKISVNLSGLIEKTHFPGAQGQGIDVGIFNATAPNAFPVKWENGLWATQNGVNPVGDLTETGYRTKDNTSLQSSFLAEQKLDFVTPGLAVKILGSYDAGFYKEKQWLIPYKTYIRTGNGYETVSDDRKASLYENFFESRATTFEAHITYNRSFGASNVTALLLYTQSDYHSDNFNAGRSLFNSSAIDQLFAGPVLNATNGGSADQSGREGYVGRITYSYDGRYLLEANFGYNGSENFPLGNRFGFFPSASAGWVLSREKFLASSKIIDFLKLRVSYGVVGNDKIGGRRFLYQQPFYYGNGYVFGGNSPVPVQSIYAGGLANPNVTWEKARKTNIGVDAQLLKQKIDFKLDVFYEKRNNILATRDQSVPGSFGADLPVENIAKVNNSGFEIELAYHNKISEFIYSISGNLTYAHNKIVFIDEPENVPNWQKATGQPIGQYFGFISDGLYLTQEQLDNNPKISGVEPGLGDIRYRDINDDKMISDLDRTAIGHSRTPEIIYGINLSLQYRGFDLSGLIQGAGRSSVYFSEEAAWEFLYGANPLEAIKGRYNPDGSNPNPTYPRLSLNRNQYKKEGSSYWLRNAAYWRLKNLELGYTFPESLLGRAHIQSLRIFIASTNLFTQAKFKDWDPESPGGANYYFPQMKVNNIGINLSF